MTASEPGAGATGAVDWDALATLLRRDGVEVDGALRAERVGDGQSNLSFRVTDGRGAVWLVRRPPLGELQASAHDVRREARIIEAVRPSGVPAPRVIASYDESATGASPIVVLEFVEGLVVDRMSVAEALPTEVRGAITAAMSHTLCTVHEVDVESSGLSTLSSHSPYALRQVKRWSRQWDGIRTRELPGLDRLTDLLNRAAPPNSELCLVHGDFHIRNLIVDPFSGRVRAVLDWELSTLGDPLADVGTLLAYWPEADDPPTGLYSATALPGFGTRDEVVERYLSESGRDGATIGYWHTLGLWKLAIIAEGILRRRSEDSRNSNEGAPTPEVVSALIDHAWSVAAGSGLAGAGARAGRRGA